MKKLYYGRRELGSRVTVCFVAGKTHTPLPPCNDLWDHSPDGFEWGYHGSGPAQLALAILHHVTQCPHLSIELHQSFKRDVISKLDKDQWMIPPEFVTKWIFNACEARWSTPSEFTIDKKEEGHA